jgi:hypothetical protein
MSIVQRVAQVIGGLIMMLIGLLLLYFAYSIHVAHAQQYDSSYGYEQRGFVPPSPALRPTRRRPCD